jgi:hypothetical protein
MTQMVSAERAAALRNKCLNPGKLLSGFRPILKYTFVRFPGTKPELARNGVGAGIPRGNRGD